MAAGFFRLKMKGQEESYDTKIFEYADIDNFFEAFSKCVSDKGAFQFKVINKTHICVPVDNIQYIVFVPEEFVKDE